MTTYTYSTLPAAKTITGFLPTDTLYFNNDDVNAGSAVFTVNAAGDAILTISGKAITFSGLTLDNLNPTNFTFSNGGHKYLATAKTTTSIAVCCPITLMAKPVLIPFLMIRPLPR